MDQRTYKDEVDRKLAKSLTANTPELIPYLPYLLMDLWELGSSPADMKTLIESYLPSPERLNVIDFGCGKGAVPIHLARTLGCHVKGIDLMPQFIEEAQLQADANEVSHLCEFVIDDIIQAVLIERNYDIAILDAIGDVLGTPAETIRMVRHVVKESGFLLINDAYKKEDVFAVESQRINMKSDKSDLITEDPKGKKNENLESPFLTYDEWLALFETEGLEVVEKIITEEQALFAFNRLQIDLIKNRVEELKALHSDKWKMFDDFLKNNEQENLSNKESLKGITWLLRKKQFIPSRYL